MGTIEPRDATPRKCEICGGTRRTNRHHLIPRAYTQKHHLPESLTAVTCADCHDSIHWFISHHELATKYNTVEALRAKFIALRTEAEFVIKVIPKISPPPTMVTPKRPQPINEALHIRHDSRQRL